MSARDTCRGAWGMVIFLACFWGAVLCLLAGCGGSGEEESDRKDIGPVPCGTYSARDPACK
jgi:hypothetical protein